MFENNPNAHVCKNNPLRTCGSTVDMYVHVYVLCTLIDCMLRGWVGGASRHTASVLVY